MRATHSLDGIWQARLDPDDIGLAQAWARPETSFDRELPVPLPWQAADPALRQYAGVVWYRRSFTVPTDWRESVVTLRFGAVDYAATVWLNGQAVGGHEGGYTPFEVEISAHLRWDQPNVVTLRVVDPADLDEIPHGKQGGRWYTSISGPWQSVTLVRRPVARVERLRCYPDALRGAVRVVVTCLPGSGIHRARLTVLEADGDRSVASAIGLVSAEAPEASVEMIVPDPRLWEPDTPYRYRLRATLESVDGTALDEVEERFGLRTVEARGGQVLLNGKPCYLRGALDQAYWPDTLYTAPTDDEIEREIRLAKEMGLNLLRKHIKPEDPRYLEAADRLGLLIWAEPANPMAFTEAGNAALRRDLLEMIDRDFNRPSVIIWSLYNEDWGLPHLWNDPDKQCWLRDLYHEVKALDPTRLVCDNSGWAHVLSDLNDYHEYYAAPERMGRFRERLDFILSHPLDNFSHGHVPAGEPILISEFGNWGLPDPAVARQRSGGSEPPWFAYDRAYARATGLPPPRPENPLTERIKTIRGAEERFVALGLDRVFGSFADLTRHLQTRAFRALKAQIEEMRRRPALCGYVVTEFSDIEWECNGWLDYWRQPKVFHHDLADINADVALIAMPEQTTAWGGDTVVVVLHVANTTPVAIDGAVRWWLEGSELAGETPATAPPFATTCLPTAIRLRAPDDAPLACRLRLELACDGVARASAYAEVAFAPRAAGLVEGRQASGHTLDRVFRQRLERHGYRIPRGFSPDVSLAITNRLDTQLWEHLEAGGHVLYIASTSSEGAELAGLRFNALSPAESWRMASGAAWARADRLAPAPVLPELGWEAAAIFPTQSIDAGSLLPGDEQLAGWFEGWLANAGAFAVVRQVGRGRLLATTFRFEDTYGLDPVSTLLLNRLVALLVEEPPMS